MTGARILIVEDELLIAADLSMQLRQLGYTVLATLESGEEALEFLRTEKPDLILLDIQLAGDLDGIDTAHRIKADHGIPFLFLTSNTDERTFNRASVTQPAAYLAKPFREIDVRNSIELALRGRKSSPAEENESLAPRVTEDRLFVREKERMIRIMLAEVLWVEADRYYCWIVTEQKKYLATLSLKKIAEQLPATHFVRVSRSYLINLERVDQMDDHYVFIGTHTIGIGKSYKEELMRRLRTF